MRELPRRGNPNWLWLLALAPFAVLMARQWSYGCGLSCGDYAQYYQHADALLHGRSYSDIGYIYTSYSPWIGPPAQPPGFPLTLVPIFALFGPNRTAIKLLLLVSALLFLTFAGLRVARSDGRLPGAAVVMLTGVALASMYATDSALSDLGFCALLWAFVLIADRPATGRGGGSRCSRCSDSPRCPIGRRGRRSSPPRSSRVHGPEWAARNHAGGDLDLRRRCGGASLARGHRGDIRVGVDAGALLLNTARTLDTLRSAIFELLLYPFPWRIANGAYHVLGTLVMAWGFVRMLHVNGAQ